MTWNSVAYPAGWVNVTTARHGNLLLESDAVTFTLSASTAVAYEVRDYYGEIVRTGTPSGLSLTLTALPLGWYKLYLYRGTSIAVYGTLIGVCHFAVIRAGLGLVNPPAPSGQGGAELQFAGQDHIIRGVAQLGPYRNSLDEAADPTDDHFGGNIARTQADRVYQRDWYEANPDSARPRPAFLQFPNGTSEPGADVGIALVVDEMYPDVQYFEGPSNEPDLNNPATATKMQAFTGMVKDANPAAKVMGPGLVSINAPELDKIRTFLTNDGMDGADAFSFHFYNCVNGDITLGRRTMDGFLGVLAEFGLEDIELWQTEWGQFAATYGVFSPRRQARWAMMHRLLLDQYGVPKERDFWFYDRSHGFWDFPSFWKFGDEITPMIPMTRVYSQEVFGKTWEERLDFGTVENDLYIGSRYEAVDGSAVLALLSDSRTDGQVRLLVTGDDSLAVVGPFGAVTTVDCDTDGTVTVPVTMEPTYVRLPVGVTATVEQVRYGQDYALGATGSAPGTADIGRPVNGILENAFYLDGSPTEYRDDTALPSYYIATFPTPRLADTVMVHCPSPWQSQGTFLDFDIDYQDDNGDWHTIETVNEPALTFASATNSNHTGCTFDSYHSGRCVFVAELPTPRLVAAVRVYVRDATAGGEVTTAAEAAGGQGNSFKCIRLQELAVYCRAPTAHRRVAGSRIAL